jgi:hypothetical protein
MEGIIAKKSKGLGSVAQSPLGSLSDEDTDFATAVYLLHLDQSAVTQKLVGPLLDDGIIVLLGKDMQEVPLSMEGDLTTGHHKIAGRLEVVKPGRIPFRILQVDGREVYMPAA